MRYVSSVYIYGAILTLMTRMGEINDVMISQAREVMIHNKNAQKLPENGHWPHKNPKCLFKHI